MIKLLSIICTVVFVLILIWLRLERKIVPRESTVAFWRLSNTPLLKRIEGHIYGARTMLYLKMATSPRLLALARGSESADSYHGKVLTGSDAAKLITIDRPVILTDLKHVVPYSRARDIVLSGQEIAVLQCPCRELKRDSCEPRDVCLVIGEPFASFVVDHQPEKARMISIDEALDIIYAEERRGHIHTAWFKDAMHDRFYAICNCCPCCCLGMASFFRGTPRLAHSGYRPKIDYDSCEGCGRCIEVCPFIAMEIDDGDRTSIKLDKCMGCGLCVSHCSNGAISLELAPGKGIPLAMDLLQD
ncbi:MAG: ferredoxin family protein [Actinobacteria bacterium]|nr:ferredoxin family protein [Actinomycetota bacterium]